jgi:hypothetical protein
MCGFYNKPVLSGRPYGGCAILWQSTLNASVSVVQTISTRICPMQVESQNNTFLLISVYLPYECPEENTSEFCTELSTLDYFVSSNADCHITVCGDFNVHLSRKCAHTNLFTSFCERTDLCVIDNPRDCTIDYTYNFDMRRLNVLDHSLTSSTLFDVAVASAVVWHDDEYLSYHDPLVLTSNIKITVPNFVDKICRTPNLGKNPVKRIRCGISKHFMVYLLVLIGLIAATQCHNPTCTNGMHYQTENQYSRDIADACLNVVDWNLPRIRHSNFQAMPG